MGFIQAFKGSISETLSDQWKEFFVPQQDVPATAAIFPAVLSSKNNGKGENTNGSANIISNGSKFVIYEGTALVTMQDGAITGFISEPGGFEFKSDDPNSKSVFAGDGVFGQAIKSTWEKFKFGGQPGSQQLAFYVNLKEIPNNKFGTTDEKPFFDSFLQTQVSITARGVYSLKIVDPLLFIKQVVPIKYLQPNAPVFDFADMDNDTTNDLFGDVVDSLGTALAKYTSDPEIQGSLIKVQADQTGFGKAFAEALETDHQWKTNKGLEIVKASIISINYDEETKELLKATREDDREIRKQARLGQMYSNNMAGMMAAGSIDAMQKAASNENGAMMGFAGFNMAQTGSANMMGAVSNLQQSQPSQPVQQAPAASQPAEQDPVAILTEKKKLLDAGLITQEDYDKIKNQLLGL